MNGDSLPRDDFDGPLDLLLDEVRRQRIAIEDIALAPLVARYLAYMEAAAADGRPLDIDWILLAATLIQWKSRSLLPAPAGAPAGDPVRDEIVELLVARRKQAVPAPVPRGADPELPEEAASGGDPARPFVSVWDLTQQAGDLARWAAQHGRERRLWRQSFPPEEESITVAEMSEYLQAQFGDGNVLDASALLVRQPTPLRRVYLFLALLEMARARALRLVQAEESATIWLHR